MRTRRQKLQPEDLGIVAGSAQGRRRRTPGLRREEVAELAGVGTTWYTWLEQARDIQPSVEVLLRLAQALKLNHIETRHLFALSCKALPMDQDISKELVSESLLRLLQKSMVAPAVLLGARWDILATNSFAQTDFADMVHLPENRQNWVYYVFCILKGRERLRSWEAEARRVLAEFRSSVSETLDNPWILEVVDYMKKESPEFSQWWPEHDVRDNAPTQVNVHSAAATAPYAYERMVLRPFENLRYKILIFTPLLALS